MRKFCLNILLGIRQAEEATEEVKRKVMSGAINLKKANERSTFKRSKVLEKRRVSSVVSNSIIIFYLCFDYALSVFGGIKRTFCVQYENVGLKR